MLQEKSDNSPSLSPEIDDEGSLLGEAQSAATLITSAKTLDQVGSAESQLLGVARKAGGSPLASAIAGMMGLAQSKIIEIRQELYEATTRIAQERFIMDASTQNLYNSIKDPARGIFSKEESEYIDSIDSKKVYRVQKFDKDGKAIEGQYEEVTGAELKGAMIRSRAYSQRDKLTTDERRDLDKGMTRDGLSREENTLKDARIIKGHEAASATTPEGKKAAEDGMKLAIRAIETDGVASVEPGKALVPKGALDNALKSSFDTWKIPQREATVSNTDIKASAIQAADLAKQMEGRSKAESDTIKPTDPKDAAKDAKASKDVDDDDDIGLKELMSNIGRVPTGDAKARALFAKAKTETAPPTGMSATTALMLSPLPDDQSLLNGFNASKTKPPTTTDFAADEEASMAALTRGTATAKPAPAVDPLKAAKALFSTSPVPSALPLGASTLPTASPSSTLPTSSKIKLYDASTNAGDFKHGGSDIPTSKRNPSASR